MRDVLAKKEQKLRKKNKIDDQKKNKAETKSTKKERQARHPFSLWS